MNARFTLDGSDALEGHLAQTCQAVLGGVQALIPSSSLDALVLGGGYGRGQGGVLRSATGDRPYNDLEFYVFTRGNVLLNEHRYRSPLQKLGDQLSPAAGLHVEFKIYSRDKLRTGAVSMFTYDLLSGHRLILGNRDLLRGCEHHLRADQIPLHEATRLLFNRCSGLLLAKDLLRQQTLTAAQTDFVARNLAKAQLALGDAVLAVHGQYHWDCRERHARLKKLASAEILPWLPEVRQLHATGVEFKLHPRVTSAAKPALQEQHCEVSKLACQLWLWLESHRLKHPFATVRDYALSPLSKCPESSRWRNALLNLRTFKLPAVFDGRIFSYPRERLLNALSLLLWDNETLTEVALRQYLQKNLQADSAAWPDLLRAYQTIWQNYG
ncbi:MAG: hypothetical protein JWR69_4179 [Pedosphaera sp.]|nr:hypothetical protein [Pedosphaera sp.]